MASGHITFSPEQHSFKEGFLVWHWCGHLCHSRNRIGGMYSADWTSLLAANGTKIKIYRKYTFVLQFMSNKYEWDFVLAYVTCQLRGWFLEIAFITGRPQWQAFCWYCTLPHQKSNFAAPQLGTISTSNTSHFVQIFHKSPCCTLCSHILTLRGAFYHYEHTRARPLSPEKLVIAKQSVTKWRNGDCTNVIELFGLSLTHGF